VIKYTKAKAKKLPTVMLPASVSMRVRENGHQCRTYPDTSDTDIIVLAAALSLSCTLVGPYICMVERETVHSIGCDSRTAKANLQRTMHKQPQYPLLIENSIMKMIGKMACIGKTVRCVSGAGTTMHTPNLWEPDRQVRVGLIREEEQQQEDRACRNNWPEPFLVDSKSASNLTPWGL
jgi:hypothetical protein